MKGNPFYQKLSKPIFQSAFSLIVIIVIILSAKLLDSMGVTSITPKFYWRASSALLFFYVIMNSLFSLSTENSMIYWRDSVYSFLLLAGLGALIAYWASSLSVFKAGSYYSIYLVITIGYLVFSSIASILRKLVDYAENEEWEAPRSKKRK